MTREQDASEWSRIQQAAALGRERRLAEQARREKDLVLNATPETIQKCRADQIEKLEQRGSLGAEQKRAAQEICRVWLRLTADVLPRIRGLTREGGAGHGQGQWPPGLSRAYQERYCPWRDESGARRIGHRSTEADLVFMIVVDNYSLRATARHFSMHHSKALRLLRENLYRYAEIAGWIDTPIASVSIHRASQTISA